jgi:predicted SnoaL-like aldol condensation-catalyzing enzyme
MTPDALVREWFEEVWNRLDETAIDRLLHPEAIAHGLSPEPLRGPAEFKPFYQAFREGFSGIHVDVVRTVVEGDLCVAHCHVVARHTGDSLGGPATHRTVDYWGMSLVRVKDGKLVEGWNSFDFLTMYQQIGWVGAPVAPVL